MNSQLSSQNPSVRLVLRFQDHAERFSRFVGEENIQVTPFASSDLPIFRTLSVDEQSRAVDELERALSVFEEVRAGGHLLTDTPQLLWRSLKKLGYIWESDFFDKIGPGDVVQAFSTEQKMIFWNLKLLHMVSYTVEQLFCTRWWLMGSRMPDVSPQIINAVTNVLEAKIPGTFDPQIPEHILSEDITEDLLKFVIHIKYVSPLKKDGKIAGFLAINSAEEIS